MGSLDGRYGLLGISPRSLMRWASSIALAAVVVASSTSPARGASEGNNALCSQDFDSAEYLVRCDAAAWSLVATGRSYAWKFWYDTNDSSSRRYKILGGAAVSWPYDGPGRYFFQLTVSNGTPSGTQVYGPYAVEVADAPPADEEPNPPTEPTPEPDNQPEPVAVTAGFQVSAASVKVNEDVTFTADQAAADDIWFQWQFSDGYGSYSASLTRSFSSAGNIGVKLSVYQKEGGKWNLADVSEWETITVRSDDLKPLVVVEGTVGENVGLGVTGDVAWVLGRTKFATVNVASPDDAEFGEIIATSEQFRYRATALAVSDQLIAVGAGSLGVFLFDAADPFHLEPISSYAFFQTQGSTFRYPVLALHFDGDRLVVGLSHGLRVLSVIDPESPRIIGSAGGFTVRSVFSREGTILAGSQRPLGFTLFPMPNAASTESTELIASGFVPTKYMPRQFASDKNLLIVNENSYVTGDVSFFDASSDYRPVGRVGGGGAWYRGVAVAGGKVYSALGDDVVGMKFVESASTVISSTPLGSGNYGFFLASDARDRIYVGTNSSTLVVLGLD